MIERLQDLDSGKAHRLAVAILDAAGDPTGRRHRKLDTRNVLAVRNRNRDTAPEDTALQVLGRRELAARHRRDDAPTSGMNVLEDEFPIGFGCGREHFGRICETVAIEPA